MSINLNKILGTNIVAFEKTRVCSLTGRYLAKVDNMNVELNIQKNEIIDIAIYNWTNDRKIDIQKLEEYGIMDLPIMNIPNLRPFINEAEIIYSPLSIVEKEPWMQPHKCPKRVQILDSRFVLTMNTKL